MSHPPTGLSPGAAGPDQTIVQKVSHVKGGAPGKQNEVF
jgi:hypothetical protein